jgi:hypothetical protein
MMKLEHVAALCTMIDIYLSLYIFQSQQVCVGSTRRLGVVFPGILFLFSFFLLFLFFLSMSCWKKKKKMKNEK